MAAKRVEAETEAPRPTVREAMRSVLASAKLVAGADGLDRQVEWVRLMETPEVQPRAGDLMFTSGFPIKDDLDAQIRLVGRIAEGGGAGLVVRPLPYLRRLPPEMVTEADRLKVPLFTISSDVQFVDLMSPLLERIISADPGRQPGARLHLDPRPSAPQRRARLHGHRAGGPRARAFDRQGA